MTMFLSVVEMFMFPKVYEIAPEAAAWINQKVLDPLREVGKSVGLDLKTFEDELDSLDLNYEELKDDPKVRMVLADAYTYAIEFDNAMKELEKLSSEENKDEG